jgi:prepilin-type N-terminal cleavage/methylation domain-containing protein
MIRVRAFTLIELVTVMVVISMLIVFAPLALDSLVAERELESEVSRLGTTIEMIHTQAILDQALYAMHFDMEEARYAYQIPDEVEQEMVDEGDEPMSTYVLDMELDLAELDWHRLPGGFKLTLYEGRTRFPDGSYRVLFRPDGTVPPHTIVIESDNVSSLDDLDRSRTIKVNFPGFVSYSIGSRVEDFKKTAAELGE